MNDTEHLTYETLLDEFRYMVAVDEGVKEEAPAAYRQMLVVPIDDLDRAPDEKPEDGTVKRRAPLNPFNSVKLGKYKKEAEDAKKKADDPALRNNPLRGRLLVTLGSTMILFFVFSQALIYNRLFEGDFYDPSNGNIGPSAMTLYNLGGLNTNAIREGEVVRLFWSMWMHSGWLHILFNLVIQLQFLYMIEPDWGFTRTLLLFFISGITGNLVSSVADPCTTTVGSSGALFGLMGGLVAYCIEYWKTIPRPILMLVVVVVVIIITIATGFTEQSDNWAHMGGMFGGLCWGFGTISSIEICYGCCCCAKESQYSESAGVITVKEGELVKKKIAKETLLQKLGRKGVPRCRCGWREWLVRSIALVGLFLVWFLSFWYLLETYEYAPPGHVTYKGVRACCCGYSPDDAPADKVNWKCAFCDLGAFKVTQLTDDGLSELVHHNMTWGDFLAPSLEWKSQRSEDLPLVLSGPAPVLISY